MRTEVSSDRSQTLTDEQQHRQVTATELIDGVQHLLILEQDETGCYREVGAEPVYREPHAPKTPHLMSIQKPFQEQLGFAAGLTVSRRIDLAER